MQSHILGAQGPGADRERAQNYLVFQVFVHACTRRALHAFDEARLPFPCSPGEFYECEGAGEKKKKRGLTHC